MGGWNGVEVKAKTLKDDIGKLAYDLYEGTPALQNLAKNWLASTVRRKLSVLSLCKARTFKTSTAPLPRC